MFWGKLFEEFFENFISLVFAFTFSFCHQKEKDNKKKDCRLRSGAKKSTYFPKRKELASLKQLFVLNGKYSIFLHAPPLRPEVALLGGHIASLVVWMYTRSFTTLRTTR
jgi:predicted DNA-binding protein with PD1-like motif